MSQAHKRNRSSKRDVIVLSDEDSSSEQPAKKNAKMIEEEDIIVLDDEESIDAQPVEKRRAETVPSPNVVQLQQEVLKLKEDLKLSHLATRTAELRAEAAEKQLSKSQDMFQRACVAARTSELRAEAAESRLDSKYGIKDELEAEKKRADDLEKSVAEISSRWDEARLRADTAETRNNDLVLQNEALKTELAETKSALEEKEKDFEKALKLCVKSVETAARFNEEMKRGKNYVATPDEVNKLHDIGHPTNIFKPCRSDSGESTPFETARKKLASVIENAEGSGFCKRVKQLFSNIPVRERHLCELCGIQPKHYGIMVHFLSKQHSEKVSALGAAVSTAALDYWLDKLTPEKEDQEGAATAAIGSSSVDISNKLHVIGHPTNIFQLCSPDSSESMSYEKAREKILSTLALTTEGTTISEKANHRLLRFPELKLLMLNCHACAKGGSLCVIITHFLGSKHRKKMRDLGAAVSSAALDYWVDKLIPEVEDKEESSSIDATAVNEGNSLKNTGRSGPKPLQRLW